MGFGGKRLGGCVRAYLVGAQKDIARACVCVSVRGREVGGGTRVAKGEHETGLMYDVPRQRPP